MYQNTIYICISWFIYFLDLLWVRYNCAKFRNCRICVTDFGEMGLFGPPHPWVAPKKPILNRINRRKRQETLDLVKDFNTFMCNHTLHRRKKHFCRYWLRDFSTEEILKCHIKDCFKINGKKKIIMPKKRVIC